MNSALIDMNSGTALLRDVWGEHQNLIEMCHPATPPLLQWLLMLWRILLAWWYSKGYEERMYSRSILQSRSSNVIFRVKWALQWCHLSIWRWVSVRYSNMAFQTRFVGQSCEREGRKNIVISFHLFSVIITCKDNLFIALIWFKPCLWYHFIFFPTLFCIYKFIFQTVNKCPCHN